MISSAWGNWSGQKCVRRYHLRLPKYLDNVSRQSSYPLHFVRRYWQGRLPHVHQPMSHREHPSHFDAWFEETYTRHTNLTFKESKANQSFSDIYVHKRDKAASGQGSRVRANGAPFTSFRVSFAMMDHLILSLTRWCRFHRIGLDVAPRLWGSLGFASNKSRYT